MTRQLVGFPLMERTCTCICILFILALSVLFSGCVGNLIYGDGIGAPYIVPITNAMPPPQPEYTFLFQDRTVTLTMPVNGSVYAGAKAADKDVTIYGNVSEQDWVSKSYRAMMDDSAQDEFYATLLGKLGKIRADLMLDDDEYLELITVFVQSIPYETSGENPPKFPVEIFVDRSGDCDDKGLLLAGLLSREGYKAALLSFKDESHLAVGIVCPGTDYKKTGYAYVETTNVTFVGIPPDGLAGGIVIHSDPLVVPVGSGMKNYSACGQTKYLHDTFLSTGDRFSSLSKEAEQKKAELQALAATNNVNAYNQRVAYYNSLVIKLKQNAEVYNYILNHQYDRKGTYAWVLQHSGDL